LDEKGKTVGLLLRLTRSIWNTGRLVILDSGFCVLKGIIELKKKGVHFEDKEVSDVDAWPVELDGEPFHVFVRKEPDYVMSNMATYGTTNNEVPEGGTRREWAQDGTMRRKTFKYTEVIFNHFENRHSVDDHNAKRHQPISLEQTWATKNWADRQFAFFLLAGTLPMT
jgi:hypothetical protein